MCPLLTSPLAGQERVRRDRAHRHSKTLPRDRKTQPDLSLPLAPKQSHARAHLLHAPLSPRSRILLHSGPSQRPLAVCFFPSPSASLTAPTRYNLDPSETWLPNLVHHVYTTPVQDLCFRRLSLLFIMMSIGLLVDLNQQNEPPRADLYHRLARASLCEMNLMDEPNLDLIQTLVRHPLSNPCHHLHRPLVLHDLVPSHFLRQEPGSGLCLEHHGTRCEVGAKCKRPYQIRSWPP